MSHAEVPLNKAIIKEINIDPKMKKMGKVKPVASYAIGKQPTTPSTTPRSAKQGGRKVGAKK